MKHSLNTLTILLLGLLLGACSDQIQDEDLNLTPGLKGVKSQEVLYKAKDFIVLCNETSSTIENEILNIKGTIKRKQAVTGMYLVHSNEKDFLDKAKKIKGINAVIPDIQLQCIKPDEDFSDNAIALSIGSNEEYFGYLWGLNAINAPQAWDKGFTGNGVSIYILDSGIDAEHPDIAPILNTELSKSFVENEDFNIEPGFYFNHGTHVAGIIAASDGPDLGGYDFGVIGVAPKASIVAVKVLSEYTGSGAFSGIYSGVVYAANNGADVINMSLGSDVPRNGFLVELEDGSIVKVGADDVAHYINYAQKAINLSST